MSPINRPTKSSTFFLCVKCGGTREFIQDARDWKYHCEGCDRTLEEAREILREKNERDWTPRRS